MRKNKCINNGIADDEKKNAQWQRQKSAGEDAKTLERRQRKAGNNERLWHVDEVE